MSISMGKTLRRYIVREVAAAFVAGLAIFTFVLLVARILELVDLVLARGVPGHKVLVLFAYILPSFLELAIPMAVLLASVVAFGRLATDGEITGIRAAGIQVHQLLRPVITFGLAVAVLTFTLAAYVSPWANRRIEDTLYDIAKTRATAALRPRLFNTSFGGMVIYVDGLDQQHGLMRGILLSDERESYRRTTILATAGRLVANEEVKTVYLRLLDGTSVSYHAAQESYDKTDFESLEVNLDLEKDMPEIQTEDQGPRNLDWQRLLAAKRAREARGEQAVEEDIEIQRKFALAGAGLLLGMIGVPLGIQRSRAVRARGLAVSIIVILAYYVLLSMAVTLARSGTLGTLPAMWMPNAVVALLTLYFMRRVSRDQPPLPSLPVLAWLRRRRREGAGR
jgi:lipopolysaccharide export system permease protein